jgi:cytochrome c oxidase subunit 2
MVPALSQSAGPQAQLLENLSDLMHGAAAVIFVLVVGALLLALVRRRAADDSVEEPAREMRMSRVVAVAVGATVLILLATMLTSFGTGRRLAATPSTDAIQIRVTGHQWWWEVQYRDRSPAEWATTANEIHVPVGRPVVLELQTADVIHSFWVPELGAKRDMIPGEATSIWFQADTPGVYRGQCAEFCGHQHAKMGLLVVAETPAEYAAWLDRQRDSARTPAGELARHGQNVFIGSSCPLCHAIAGTDAGGRLGPDLTHLASRRTLAAATMPNRRGFLAGWISDPQSIKPGTTMPPTPLSPRDLHALLAYLEGLK